MEKRSTYLWKIIWVIGLIILAMFNFNLEKKIQQIVSQTYNIIPAIWFEPCVSFVFGFYISLIFVKKWSFNLDASLFWCVSIPCIVLAFAIPIWSTVLPIEFLPENIATSIFSWLVGVSTSNVFGIIAGLALMLSIFNSQSKSENQ